MPKNKEEEDDNEENEDEEGENDEGGDEEGEDGEEKEDEEEKEGEEGENEEGEDEEKEEEGENEEGEDEEKEGEDEEKEGEEDEENGEEEENEKKNNKKGKKNSKKEKVAKIENQENGGKIEDNKIKFEDKKLTPTKEVKIDLKCENVFTYNGNDFTLGSIPIKKSSLDILKEISSEMESLSIHLDKVMPKFNYNRYEDSFSNNNFNVGHKYTTSIQTFNNNLDKEDIEIQNLINKVNKITKTNNNYNNLNNSIKTFEDKCCQSEDEIDLGKKEEIEDQSINNINQFDQKSRIIRDSSYRNQYPYDPTKHIEYYNSLKNNNIVSSRINNMGRNNQYNNFGINNNEVNKNMDDLYRMDNFIRKPIVYSQPNSNVIRNNANLINNNDNGNISYSYKNENYFDGNNFNNNLKNNMNNNQIPPYQRFKPSSISQAMDILLDKS